MSRRRSVKPILFDTPMVQAILDEKKDRTRIPFKTQPVIDESGMWTWKDCQWMEGGLGFPASGIEDHAPYQVGNILWVRESWRGIGLEGTALYGYRADDLSYEGKLRNTLNIAYKYKPSVHMPKEAARIFLKVTDVRVEQVQDITEEDAGKEGAHFHVPVKTDFVKERWEFLTARTKFCSLWDSQYEEKGNGWLTNPWVWVIEFKKIKPDCFMCEYYDPYCLLGNKRCEGCNGVSLFMLRKE